MYDLVKTLLFPIFSSSFSYINKYTACIFIHYINIDGSKVIAMSLGQDIAV